MAVTDTRVGFVGLGRMGGNMAARLLAGGYTVSGWTRRRESAEQLIADGLRWCDSARAAAQAAEVVLTSLPDDDALEEVAAGPEGLLAGLDRGRIWVDTSTVSPQASRELALQVSERGSAMLDAPVSGSVQHLSLIHI